MEETASRGPDHPLLRQSAALKVIAYGRKFEDVRRKAMRALQETQIKGVETNIPFLLNVLNHPAFAAGRVTRVLSPGIRICWISRRPRTGSRKYWHFWEISTSMQSKGKNHISMYPYFRGFQDKELAGLQGPGSF